MGFSPSAHLVFGVHVKAFNEDTGEPSHELFKDEDQDWNIGKYLASRSGLSDPYDDLPYEIMNGSNEVYERWGKNHLGWVEKRDNWSLISRQYEVDAPIELQVIGHYDDPEPTVYFVLRKYEFSSGTWDPRSIDQEDLDVDEIDILKARRFCDENELPSFVDARWYLVASYG
jgi:hypothetical protein